MNPNATTTATIIQRQPRAESIIDKLDPFFEVNHSAVAPLLLGRESMFRGPTAHLLTDRLVGQVARAYGK